MKKITLVLLLLITLILFNFIGSTLSSQVDLTEGNIYTLSEGTEKILQKIEEPIYLDFYFSRGMEDLPIYFKNYATLVENLLRQYQKASKGKVFLRIIDPRPDSPEEEMAIRQGISGQQMITGDSLFFGLTAIQADQENTLPLFSQDREQFLEYDISQLIYEVQKIEKPTLGLITSLDILPRPPANPYIPSPSSTQGWVLAEEWQRSYNILTIDGDNIPDGVDILAIIHPPADLSGSLKYSIDQFLLQGNSLFIALDPSSYYQRSQQRQPMMMMRGNSSDLPKLLASWGITYDPSQIIGDFKMATPVSAGLRYPVWLTAREFQGNSPAIAQLEMVQLIESGSFHLHQENNLSLQPLIQSTKESGELMASTLSFMPPDRIASQITPDLQVRTIAGIITGDFKTAFPEGRPKEDTEKESQEDVLSGFPEGVEKTKGLLNSRKPGRIIFIADTDFLVDQFTVQRGNFLGTEIVQPINDNLAFCSNLIDLLGGSQDLISIRGKGKRQRIFSRIDEMQQKAQKRFQSRLEQVETRVTEVQEKMRDLQVKSDNTGKLVASPEVLEVIETLRQEEAEARAERRIIRKELREDIENLEMVLAAFNLVPIPLILLIFGIQFFIRRNRN